MKRYTIILSTLLLFQLFLNAGTIRYRHVSHINPHGVAVSPVQGGVGASSIYIFDGNGGIVQRLPGREVEWEYDHTQDGDSVYFPKTPRDMLIIPDGMLIISRDRSRIKWIKTYPGGLHSVTTGERVRD